MEKLSVGLHYFSLGKYREALTFYVQYIANQPDLARFLDANLSACKARYRAERSKCLPRVAIACWHLGNNAAGRAATLADLYSYSGYETDIIGFLLYSKGGVWPPIKDSARPCYAIQLTEHSRLLEAATNFVLAHPYDVVHLSKPRLPNIVLGLLYKLIWDATVLMDVDDEELAFVGQKQALPLTQCSKQQLQELAESRIVDALWCQVSVGFAGAFDGVTVSNPALAKHYGGFVIPHVRNGREFVPSQLRRQQARQQFGISENRTVFLFFGTPRAHKGLLETATALAALNNPNFLFAVVGDFPEPELKQQLARVVGIECQFFPNQPYEQAADVIALGDACVLLQDPTSLAAEFQLPAKLIDALAMGLAVFLEPTPSTEFIVETGLVVSVTRENLVDQLRQRLASELSTERQIARHRYFQSHLSMAALVSTLTQALHKARHHRQTIQINHHIIQDAFSGNLIALLKQLPDNEIAVE